MLRIRPSAWIVAIPAVIGLATITPAVVHAQSFMQLTFKLTILGQYSGKDSFDIRFANATFSPNTQPLCVAPGSSPPLPPMCASGQTFTAGTTVDSAHFNGSLAYVYERTRGGVVQQTFGAGSVTTFRSATFHGSFTYGIVPIVPSTGVSPYPWPVPLVITGFGALLVFLGRHIRTTTSRARQFLSG